MHITTRDDRLLSLSYLWVPGVLAFLFGIVAFGGLFGSSYALQLVPCPIIFLSNLAVLFLSRSLFTYFITITSILYGITMFMHYIDVKLRLKWVIDEGKIYKYILMNKVSLFCGTVSMFGFIGTVSFPFTGMPVVQSLYFNSSSNDSKSNIESAINIIHIFHVFFGYSGFMLYSWLVLFLNIRTRCSYSSTCRFCFLTTQFFLVIILTIFLHITVIAMIVMMVFYEIEYWTISDTHPECWKENSVGYYSHIVAIGSQYIVSCCIVLFSFTLIPPLRKKVLYISLDKPNFYSIGASIPPDADIPFSVNQINGDVKHESALRTDNVSESSDVLFGNANTTSQSDSVLDLYKETSL